MQVLQVICGTCAAAPLPIHDDALNHMVDQGRGTITKRLAGIGQTAMPLAHWQDSRIERRCGYALDDLSAFAL